MSLKSLIISFIALTFMLPLSFWYLNLFNSITFSSIPEGGYFLVGGIIGFLFTAIYLMIKR